METVCYSETSEYPRATQRHNPKDSHRGENFKSMKKFSLLDNAEVCFGPLPASYPVRTWVNWQGCEDQSPPCVAKVKNFWLYTVACLVRNATNNLWILDLTLDLLDFNSYNYDLQHMNQRLAFRFGITPLLT
jgi:hypothetical protein